MLACAACFSLAGVWVTPGSCGPLGTTASAWGWGALTSLTGPFGEEGEQRTCRTEFREHGRDPRCTRRVNPGVKKDRDPRITGGMGRKGTKGEAEVCAKQLGAGELMAQSASCSWSRACPAAHGLVPACAQQHCAEGQRSRHISRNRWTERV